MAMILDVEIKILYECAIDTLLKEKAVKLDMAKGVILNRSTQK